MKKLKMARGVTLTFEEGCNKYLENCRQRNLREGTIEHYRQSYVQFYKFFDPEMPVEKLNASMYKSYVLYLKKHIDNDISINSYLRDLITTLHFFMNEEWIPQFKMQAIKIDKSHVETYTDHELELLLKKPNIKKCSFTEYQSWVMTNFLFSTGVRQRSLMNIQVSSEVHNEPPNFLYSTGFFGLFGVCAVSKTSAIFLPKIASKTATTTCLTTFGTKRLYPIRVFGTFEFLFHAK